MKVILLSNSFYQKVKSNNWREVLHKENRPYAMLNIRIDNNEYAIPIRHNINIDTHKHSFPTVMLPNKNGELKQSGLDFTKAIIIDKSDIGVTAHINYQEAKAIRENENQIKNKFKVFLTYYKNIANKHTPNAQENFIRSSSTLKYFHHELNLIPNKNLHQDKNVMAQNFVKVSSKDKINDVLNLFEKHNPQLIKQIRTEGKITDPSHFISLDRESPRELAKYLAKKCDVKLQLEKKSKNIDVKPRMKLK